MSQVESLKGELADLHNCVIEIESKATEVLDKIEAAASSLDMGITTLLPDLDLSGLDTIREVLQDLPDEIRKDARNACYFDQLDAILMALSE